MWVRDLGRERWEWLSAADEIERLPVQQREAGAAFDARRDEAALAVEHKGDVSGALLAAGSGSGRIALIALQKDGDTI